MLFLCFVGAQVGYALTDWQSAANLNPIDCRFVYSIPCGETLDLEENKEGYMPAKILNIYPQKNIIYFFNGVC